MNIALCIIVEGDVKLEKIKALYKSVGKHVAGTYITANGDETTQLQEWCKSQGIHYSYLKWSDNFAEQRNFNFSQVPSDTDYVMWADSDDVIIGAEYLPEIAKTAKKRGDDSIFFTYWYGCSFDGEPSADTLIDVELQQMRERLLKYSSIVWKGRIHETPIPVNGQNHKYSKMAYSATYDPKKGMYPVAWLHLGADRKMSKEEIDSKTQRNQRMLEAQLKDEQLQGQADPRTLLYLMKIYAESDDPDTIQKCISMGEQYAHLSGWDAERATSLLLVARCHGKFAEYDKSVAKLHEAVAQYPYDPLIYLHLSRAYYNLKNHRAMKHWLDYAINMELDKAQNNMDNMLELKLLSAELTMRYYLEVEKNPEKAWKASRILADLNPVKENKQTELYLYDMNELNKASKNVHEYLLYLDAIGQEDRIVETINALPQQMRMLPFANAMYNKYAKPRVWGDKEICYFANFNQPAIEKWTPETLKTGLGGSETAVVRLSKEWAQMGYEVTVYGDPGLGEGEYDGVTYLPYYKFNPKDKFSTFIQWRWASLAGRVSAKRFFIDLHDVSYSYDYKDKLNAIDGFFVKSQYHRSLMSELPDNKFQIISNGL